MNYNSPIPNIICEGIGETPLLERIAPYLRQARQWWTANIAPIEDGEEDEEVSPNPVIEAYALWLAAPLLDCTLHPNGLAVVRTDTLVPASPERVKEFRAALMRHIIDSLNPIIEKLSQNPKWRRSAPARRNWYATTCHTPADIIAHTGCPHDLDALTAAIANLRQAEEADAPHVWSWEMLRILRQWHPKDVSRTTDPDFLNVSRTPAGLRALRDTIRATARLHILAGNRDANEVSIKRQIRQHHQHYINTCRDNPHLCHQWHQSETARLYLAPPTYRNEKKSTGYFF